MKDPKKIVLIFFVFLFAESTIVYAITPNPLLPSDSPPIIDGIFTLGEWYNHQIFIENNTIFESIPTIETYVYFLNDENYLYVMVDATGDPTDTDGGGGFPDECLLVFHHEGVEREIEIIGTAGTEVSNDFTAKIGFGPSPNNPQNHKIYEFQIPLAFLNAEIGDDIDFCSHRGGKFGSIPFDGEDFRDNEWPQEGLIEGDYSTWDTINLVYIPELSPVGGEIVPNKIQLIIEILLLLAVLSQLSKWKYKSTFFI